MTAVARRMTQQPVCRRRGNQVARTSPEVTRPVWSVVRGKHGANEPKKDRRQGRSPLFVKPNRSRVVFGHVEGSLQDPEGFECWDHQRTFPVEHRKVVARLGPSRLRQRNRRYLPPKVGFDPSSDPGHSERKVMSQADFQQVGGR